MTGSVSEHLIPMESRGSPTPPTGISLFFRLLGVSSSDFNTLNIIKHTLFSVTC